MCAIRRRGRNCWVLSISWSVEVERCVCDRLRWCNRLRRRGGLFLRGKKQVMAVTCCSEQLSPAHAIDGASGTTTCRDCILRIFTYLTCKETGRLFALNSLVVLQFRVCCLVAWLQSLVYKGTRHIVFRMGEIRRAPGLLAWLILTSSVLCARIDVFVQVRRCCKLKEMFLQLKQCTSGVKFAICLCGKIWLP